MHWGGTLNRALVLLAPLIRGNLPEDRGPEQRNPESFCGISL